MLKQLEERQSSEGLILFARYAFAPNYFKYCGPDKNRDIGEALRGQYDERELRQILNHFEAAVPYLNLIAKANHIADCFDPRIVEAYWLGNELLSRVPSIAIHEHLTDEVKKRAKSNWKYLESEIKLEIKPHHSFHVFDIYRMAGFSRDGSKPIAVLDLINNCRISWGKISSKLKAQSAKLGNGERLVESQKIVIKDKRFVMISEEKSVKNTGLNIKEGDIVSLHWGFVCDKISERQKENLEYWTKYHLKISSRFI